MDHQKRFELLPVAFGGLRRSYRLVDEMDPLTGLEPALNGIELRRTSIVPQRGGPRDWARTNIHRLRRPGHFQLYHARIIFSYYCGIFLFFFLRIVQIF